MLNQKSFLSSRKRRFRSHSTTGKAHAVMLLASMPRNFPKKLFDCREPSKTSSTPTSLSCRRLTPRRKLTAFSGQRSRHSGMIFYLVLIASRIYRCAVRTSRLCTHHQTRPTRTRRKMTQQSCRASPSTRWTACPRKFSRSRSASRHAIRRRMRAASRAWTRSMRSACHCTRLFSRSTTQRHRPTIHTRKLLNLGNLRSLRTKSACRSRLQKSLSTIVGTTRFPSRKARRWKSTKTTRRAWTSCGYESREDSLRNQSSDYS